MLQMVEMLQGENRCQAAAEHPRLLQFTLAARIMWNIRGNERNNPTTHDHQHHVDEKDWRPGENRHGRNNQYHASKALGHNDSAILCRLSYGPSPNLGLKDNAFPQRSHERHV